MSRRVVVGTTRHLEFRVLTGDVIGVRIARNSPVLFVDGNGLASVPGDLVMIELAGDEGNELEASVVIGADQLLHASVGKLAGRALRTA